MNTAYRIVQRDLQKLVIELQEKADYFNLNSKEDRARKGAYVDCICLLKETMENLLGLISVTVSHDDNEFDLLHSSINEFINNKKELEVKIKGLEDEIKAWERRYNELREHLRAVIQSHENS